MTLQLKHSTLLNWYIIAQACFFLSLKYDWGKREFLLPCFMESSVSEQLCKIFGQKGADFVRKIIKLALDEDEQDLTANGIFDENDKSYGKLIARQDTYVVGLVLIPAILEELGVEEPERLYTLKVSEGSYLKDMEIAAEFEMNTALLLKAERIILNFITRLSGIANYTKRYLKELEGTGVTLLDTRKTLPGHRYLDKYAVRAAGAKNHRMTLADMLMVKNNHVDAAGSIAKAVEKLRLKYGEACPPIIVECRDKNEVLEAVSVVPQRILLDNMSPEELSGNLPLIPKNIEAEISGGVNLKTIRTLALSSKIRPADFISVGSITHSAPIADFSLRVNRLK